MDSTIYTNNNPGYVVELFNNKIRIHGDNYYHLTDILDNYITKDKVFTKDYKGKAKYRYKSCKLFWALRSEAPDGVLGDTSKNHYIELPYGEISLLQELNIPVREYIDNRDYSSLPLLSKNDINNEFKDDILPGITLEPYQLDSCKLALYTRVGTISSATGSGKTEMIVAILKYLRSKSNILCCIVVPTSIVGMTIRDRLYKYNYNPDNLIYLSSDKSIAHNTDLINHPDELKGKIIITHPASFDNIKNPELIDVMIYDECHHTSSISWSGIMKKVENVQYSLGFTATHLPHNLSDSQYRRLLGSIGKVIYKVDSAFLRNKGRLAELSYIPFNLNGELVAAPEILKESNDWTKIKRSYLNSEARAGASVQVIDHIAREFPNSRILVIVDQIVFGNYLADNLESTTSRVYRHYGGNKVMYHDNNGDIVNSNEPPSDPNRNIIIATSHMDEGADISNLDILVLTSAGASDKKLIQRIGRVSRLTKSIKQGFVVDLLDEGLGVLRSQAYKRSRIVKTLSISVNHVISSISEFIDTIRKFK